MEDVTEMMAVAETLTNHTSQLEEKLTERTQKLEARIGELEKEVSRFKKASV
jgi:hypothetical protein